MKFTFKKRSTLTLLFFLALLIGLIYSNIGKDKTSFTEYIIDESDFIEGEDLINGIPESQLNKDEINGLILMREEEKLARDVYLVLGEKWKMKIFSNIAESEQTHTDAVKILLDRYDIKDPLVNNDIGVFVSEDLSELYNQLVKQGEESLLEALIVGALIEDLDINDLNNLIAGTDNADILEVYNNLNRGSRNHIRAFIKQINRNGGDYIPQYISQSEFNDIISSTQEKGK